LSLAKYRVAWVDEKSGSRAAALQIATSQYDAGLSRNSAGPERIRRGAGNNRERYRFLLVGYVVMPEHVHQLMNETTKCTPSLVLKVLEQRASRDLKEQRRRTTTAQMSLGFKEGRAGLRRFWQPRFYDFKVYSAKKKREKLDYMHANAVKRGLVRIPSEWPWSGFLNYERGEKGLARIDFTD